MNSIFFYRWSRWAATRSWSLWTRWTPSRRASCLAWGPLKSPGKTFPTCQAARKLSLLWPWSLLSTTTSPPRSTWWTRSTLPWTSRTSPSWPTTSRNALKTPNLSSFHCEATCLSWQIVSWGFTRRTIVQSPSPSILVWLLDKDHPQVPICLHRLFRPRKNPWLRRVKTPMKLLLLLMNKTILDLDEGQLKKRIFCTNFQMNMTNIKIWSWTKLFVFSSLKIRKLIFEG